MRSFIHSCELYLGIMHAGFAERIPTRQQIGQAMTHRVFLNLLDVLGQHSRRGDVRHGGCAALATLHALLPLQAELFLEVHDEEHREPSEVRQCRCEHQPRHDEAEDDSQYHDPASREQFGIQAKALDAELVPHRVARLSHNAAREVTDLHHRRNHAHYKHVKRGPCTEDARGCVHGLLLASRQGHRPEDEDGYHAQNRHDHGEGVVHNDDKVLAYSSAHRNVVQNGGGCRPPLP